MVISKLSDQQESLAQAFANAWTSVFSRNYRLHMSDTESYSKGFDPNDHTEPWELAPYVMSDKAGVRYEAVTEELPMGLSLRYKYIPLKALKAAPKSVPLVIMLHGNNNDARIQGESSGWVEVAAKATLMLASMGLLGRDVSRRTRRLRPSAKRAPMMLLDRLLAKYPQIDPGRVYFTGLSAGAMNSFLYGLNNRTRIAGVAGAATPSVRPHCSTRRGRVTQVLSTCRCTPSPATGICTSHCPSTTRPRSFYTVVRAFGLVNEIAVSEMPDLALNPMFGLKLDATPANELAGRRAIIGTLSNRRGVMIKLVALTPYGHWRLQAGGRRHVGVSLQVSPRCDDRRTRGRCHALRVAMSRFAVEWLVPDQPDRFTHVVLPRWRIPRLVNLISSSDVTCPVYMIRIFVTCCEAYQRRTRSAAPSQRRGSVPCECTPPRKGVFDPVGDGHRCECVSVLRGE